MTTTKKKKAKGKRRYFCYLLNSLDPSHPRSTYIGFTVDPPRRIRQHNGDITAGAVRTRKKRPWGMVMVVTGFPTKSAALQFEWAWQHPYKDRHIKGKVGSLALKASTGKKAKMAICKAMMGLQPWSRYGLNAHFPLDADKVLFRSIVPPETDDVDKAAIFEAALSTGPLEDTLSAGGDIEAQIPKGSSTCGLCSGEAERRDDAALATCPFCKAIGHVVCWAGAGRPEGELLPSSVDCRVCGENMRWCDLIRRSWKPDILCSESEDEDIEDADESDKEDGSGDSSCDDDDDDDDD